MRNHQMDASESRMIKIEKRTEDPLGIGSTAAVFSHGHTKVSPRPPYHTFHSLPYHISHHWTHIYSRRRFSMLLIASLLPQDVHASMLSPISRTIIRIAHWELYLLHISDKIRFNCPHFTDVLYEVCLNLSLLFETPFHAECHTVRGNMQDTFQEIRADGSVALSLGFSIKTVVSIDVSRNLNKFCSLQIHNLFWWARRIPHNLSQPLRLKSWVQTIFWARPHILSQAEQTITYISPFAIHCGIAAVRQTFDHQRGLGVSLTIWYVICGNSTISSFLDDGNYLRVCAK